MTKHYSTILKVILKMKKPNNKTILTRAKIIQMWFGFSMNKSIRLAIREYQDEESTEEV